MKKVLSLMIVLLVGVAINTEAQTKGKPFVKWTTVPKNPSAKEGMETLKKAMKGEAIDGATTVSTEANYTMVWGQELYDQVLSAKKDRFSWGLSQGGEKNYGINANNQSFESGSLKAGVPVLMFKKDDGSQIVIAKYGETGCYNPLLPPTTKDVVLEEDPDNEEVPSKSPDKKKDKDVANVQYIMVPMATGIGGGSKEITYKEGKEIEREGIKLYTEGMNKTLEVQEKSMFLEAKSTTLLPTSNGIQYTTASQVGGPGVAYPSWGDRTSSIIVGNWGANMLTDLSEDFLYGNRNQGGCTVMYPTNCSYERPIRLCGNGTGFTNYGNSGTGFTGFTGPTYSSQGGISSGNGTSSGPFTWNGRRRTRTTTQRTLIRG